jgi:type I restriction enzyme S subunit
MYGGFQQIGRTGLLRIEAATNQAITAIRLSATSRVTPEFLQAWLNHEKSAWRRIAGSSRKDPNIAKSDISVFPVPIPPRKICGSLDAAIAFSDRAVQLLDQALHAKRAFKRGLMQQLLTGRMRFPEFRDRPWSTERFDRLCEEITERNGKMLGKDSVMGVIKGVGFEPMRARVRGRGELARYKVVPPGAFAYNPMRLNIGSIAYNCLGSPILVSPDYEVFRAKEGIADPAYVNQLRYSAPWSSFMKRAGAGSVRIRIYFADLSRLRVPAPSMGEQTRLANVLDLCDAEVDLLAAQRVQMKREKHALLSRVLFGDSR